jgi:predicted nuclease with TOPRIM domain
MPEGDSIEAIRHDFDDLVARVRSIEILALERKDAFEREVRAGFASVNARLEATNAQFDGVNRRFDGVNARFDGLEAELRHRFEQIDRLEERSDEVIARLNRIEGMLAKALNGGTDGTRGT